MFSSVCKSDRPHSFQIRLLKGPFLLSLWVIIAVVLLGTEVTNRITGIVQIGGCILLSSFFFSNKTLQYFLHHWHPYALYRTKLQVLARVAYQRQDGNFPNARELFSVVLGLFFHFGFLSKVEVAMAFDASRLIPSVDDSHVVSSKKLKVVNFSGNLGCDFQSNTTEDAFLKVSESFERRDFESQTSDITGRRFEGCSKDLNHGCFDSEDNILCPDEPEDPEEEEPNDDNVLDEVGADAPCVTDEPEAETLPSGEPSSSSHPSSSTPRVSGPSLPWIDVNDELEWPGGPPKYDPFDRPRSRSPRTN